jgi:hypothetical protein
MAIDRTGINSLDAGAIKSPSGSSIKYEGDIVEPQMKMAAWKGSPGMDSRKEVRDAWKAFLNAKQNGTFKGTWKQWMPKWIRANLAQGGIAGYRGGKLIKGQEHMLAYITPGEAESLQNLGGEEVMTSEGIPAYPPWDDPGASPGTSPSGGSRGGPPGGGDQGMTYTAPPVSYDPTPATAAHEDANIRYSQPSTTENILASEDLNIDRGPTDYEWEADPNKITGTMAGPTYTGTEDAEEQAEKDLEWALNYGILEKDPVTGETREGPNVRDLDTGLIGPRTDTITPPTDDKTGEGIASVPTDVIPEEETVLADPFSFEDAKAKAIQANYAPAGVPYPYRERFIDPMVGAVQSGDPRYHTGPVFPEYEELLPTKGTVTAAHGGRIGYAGGGISDLRQGYFIGKLVKKATKAIKKVAKSDLGKAALMGAGIHFAPQIASFLGGTGWNPTAAALQKAYRPGGFMGQLTSGKRLAALQTLMPGGTPAFPGAPLTGLEKSLSEQHKLAKLAAKLDPTNIEKYEKLEHIEKVMRMSGMTEADMSLTKKPGGVPTWATAATLGAMTLPYVAPDLGKDPSDDEDDLEQKRLAGLGTWRGQFKGLGESFRPVTASTVQYPTYSAQGGRIGYAGNGAQDVDPMAEIVALMSKRMTEGLTPDETDRLDKLIQATGFMEQKAQGGRIGYAGGADYYANLYSKYAQEMIQAGNTPMDIEDFVAMIKEQEKENKAQGGRIGAQEGGLMDLGGMEKDYRQEGGFVPIGGQERADDVPARLSKNEFVFTADAVRAAGGGDIDAGAEVMENVMENLERGGQVSEESQGLEGARNMFATAQRLEGVM